MNLLKIKDTENLELLPSVGSVINNKTGYVNPIHDEAVLGEEDLHVLEILEAIEHPEWDYSYHHSKRWYDALHTLDRSVVDRIANNLK